MTDTPNTEAASTAVAHRTADAMDASTNTSELWRAHAAQIRSLGESVALNCEHLAAEIDERAKMFSATVEAFAAYVTQTERRIADEHQHLMAVNVTQPIPAKANGSRVAPPPPPVDDLGQDEPKKATRMPQDVLAEPEGIIPTRGPGPSIRPTVRERLDSQGR
jgi:hypothetical protein